MEDDKDNRVYIKKYGLLKYCEKHEINNLKVIDLDSTNIDEEGVKFICTKSFPVLEILNLTNNNIGKLGIIYIINSCSDFRCLKHLYLANNVTFR